LLLVFLENSNFLRKGLGDPGNLESLEGLRVRNFLRMLRFVK